MPGNIRIPLLVAAATLATALTGCSGKSEPASHETVAADSVPTVPVTRAARADLSSDLTLTAEFEPFQEVDVMAKIAGFVKSIKVDIGDRVREGQLLAVLEIPEMADEATKAAASSQQMDAEVVTASDQLKQAESAHELAHLSYTRILDVSKKEPGLVPQQQVDEYHSRDLVAEAQVAAAKSALLAAQQRTHVIARRRSQAEDRCTITPPSRRRLRA